MFLFALFQFFFELSTRYAELDGAFKILLGQPFVVLAEVEVCSCEEHVGVVGFEGYGFVKIYDGKFRHLFFCFYFCSHGIYLCFFGVLVYEQGEAANGLLWFLGVLEEDGHA